MREVIARRKDGLLTVYAMTAVVGIFCMLISAIIMLLYPSKSLHAGLISLFILGILFIPVSVVYIVKICKTPEEIIAYEKGVLYFPDCTCSASEIKNVVYRCARGRYYSYHWGKIIIALEDRALKYDFVADVVDVHNRLIQLMMEAKEKHNV